MGATVPAAVPTEGETAPVPVAAEPAPVSASVPSAAASAPEEAPTPLPKAEPAPATSVVPAVQKQVADVVQGASGGEITRRVRSAAAEATSAATNSLESATDSVSAQPVLEGVSGSVRPVVEKVVVAARPAITKVENGVSAVERSDDVAPGLIPTAPALDRSHTGTADPTSAAGQPPLSEPAPQIREDGALPTFENAVPLDTRTVAGWIDGLNLRGLFAAPASAGRQAPGSLLESASIDPMGVASGPHASPHEAPSHPPLAPGPVSGLSTSASPGPGGISFFVPIAALLALLALAAPATSRRCKEALAAPVPSRFVCALERPG